MKSIVFVFALLCLCILGTQAKNYAVLVASSSGYENYRHQANVFHAYQVLVKNGIDRENIIVMAYDDAATHPNNPFKGQVYNAPSNKGGFDVYKGIKIDYKGKDVNPKTFLAVLTGNSSAVGGGKVLNSTAEDNVFVYLCDHGASGLVAFVDHIYLYADDLNKAFLTMYDKKMYNKFVFYLEACHSGSMFENILAPNMSIYATTSANPHESAYATFCGSDNVVNNTSMGTCLGSKYSVTFVEYMETKNLTLETLFSQYEHVKKITTGSEVMKYGDLSIMNDTAHHYQSDPAKYKYGSFEVNTSANAGNVTVKESVNNASMIDSRDVRLAYLRTQNKLHPSQSLALQIIQEIASERRFDLLFKRLKDKFDLKDDFKSTKIDFTCYKKRMAFFKNACGNFSEYGLKYASYISQTCAQNIKEDAFELGTTQACLKYKYIDIGI